ncbi:MAG: hypothetical protein AAF950_04190 [Pseudomonadota bacterium]
MIYRLCSAIVSICGVVLFGASVDAAYAQDDPANTAAASCTGSVYGEFDFWLGTWEVTDTEGVFQGRNTITREEQGCLVLERWTSAGGGTGQSYNYVDPASGAWRQVWVSSAANIDYVGGRTTSGGMRLEGEITYRSGDILPFTGEWTPRADGTVLQSFRQFNPEIGGWEDWFTGIYTRAEDDTDN